MNSAFLRGYQCPPDVFAELCASLLQSGKSIRVFARGDSMLPNLRGGDTLFCSPLDGRPVRVGDIVLYLTPNRQTLFHRVIRAREQDGERFFQVQGDNSLNPEGWKSTAEILGRVARVIRSNGMEQGMDTNAAVQQMGGFPLPKKTQPLPAPARPGARFLFPVWRLINQEQF